MLPATDGNCGFQRRSHEICSLNRQQCYPCQWPRRRTGRTGYRSITDSTTGFQRSVIESRSIFWVGPATRIYSLCATDDSDIVDRDRRQSGGTRQGVCSIRRLCCDHGDHLLAIGCRCCTGRRQSPGNATGAGVHHSCCGGVCIVGAIHVRSVRAATSRFST